MLYEVITGSFDRFKQMFDAAGSKTVTVHGNMTAGNQVRIERDFHGQHSKLTVDFDDP